jgi:hypothetical protein
MARPQVVDGGDCLQFWRVASQEGLSSMSEYIALFQIEIIQIRIKCDHTVSDDDAPSKIF